MVNIFNFHIKIHTKKLLKALGIPTVVGGIINNKPIKPLLNNTQFKAMIERLGGSTQPLLVNYIKQVGTGKLNYTVGDVFTNVLDNTPYRGSYLEKSIHKIPSGVWGRYMVSRKNDKDKKKLTNGIKSAMKIAYVEMAMKENPSTQTAQRKGHNLYWIQTGQTYKAIDAKVKEK